MAKTLKVTLARPLTDERGRSHKAGATVALPTDEARNLLHLGLARRATDATVAEEQTTTTQERK